MPTAKAIGITAFVDADCIDPIRISDSSFLAIDGQVAVKPYSLLRKAPEQSDKAAVAKFAWHNRERLGLLRARKASAAPGAPADGNNLSLAEAIDRLPAVTEDRTGYERDSFHLSVDADKNRCDTRKEVGDGPGAPAGRTRASRTSSRAKPRVPGCRSAARPRLRTAHSVLRVADHLGCDHPYDQTNHPPKLPQERTAASREAQRD